MKNMHRIFLWVWLHVHDHVISVTFSQKPSKEEPETHDYEFSTKSQWFLCKTIVQKKLEIIIE